MRVTVLFDNLGPYHIARLAAAAKQCDLTAIELHAKSRDYLWQSDGSPTTFARRIVFGSAEETDFSARDVVATLTDAIQATNPQVVAIPGWSGWHAFAALDWCATNGVPAVVMSESTADDEPRTTWKEWIKRQYLGLCAAALVGGERHARYLTQLHMPSERIFYGYDVVDNQYFATTTEQIRESTGEWCERLALPRDYFLASARFIPKKNLVALIDAYANYRSTASSTNGASGGLWDLVLLGDGELRDELQAVREQRGLTNSIHFPGFRQYDELPPYYALAAAFIHASTIEPWGLVVNEAMASGLPVLVSNRCGCARTLVREGENGRTFNPADQREITGCLIEMASTTLESRQRMGCRSRQIIAEFGPGKFADGLVEAAHAALASRGKQRRFVEYLVLKSLLRRSVLQRRQST